MNSSGGRKGVVTGGTWCCDHNKLVVHWPSEDGITEIVAQKRQAGGSGSNMAIDLKKLDPGFFVETIGVVGDDEDGRILLAEADTHGIERSQIRVSKEVSTNYTDCFTSKASGRRTHLYYQGTNAVLTPDDFDFARTRSRFLHLGLPGVHRQMDTAWKDDVNGWVAVLKKARKAGLETNMELASLPADRLAELIRPCLPQLDLLIVNDFEMGALAGMATVAEGKTNVEACVAAARKVLEAGSMRLVAVHFPKGAAVIEREGSIRIKPSVNVPIDVIVGANGAGDAFAAGMLYGVHEGWPIEDSLSLGHASAAASLRGMGTTDAVEKWQDCLRLANGWGWRGDTG